MSSRGAAWDRLDAAVAAYLAVRSGDKERRELLAAADASRAATGHGIGDVVAARRSLSAWMRLTHGSEVWSRWDSGVPAGARERR